MAIFKRLQEFPFVCPLYLLTLLSFPKNNLNEHKKFDLGNDGRDHLIGQLLWDTLYSERGCQVEEESLSMEKEDDSGTR